MACFSVKQPEQASDFGGSFEQPRIPVGAVLIGSVGVLNCASVIVTLLMAG